MRNFNVLAAIAAALLAGGAVSAKEKADQPRPKKVCRNEQISGRIAPRRVCRIVTPSQEAAQDDQRKPATSREAGNGRD
ncbi:MAG: hypothetical protein ABWX67_05380 [Allosphingosinicella sp.]